MNRESKAESFGCNRLTSSELIIGLACAVGTNIKNVTDLISNRLTQFGYQSEVIKISKQLIEPTIPDGISDSVSSFEHVSKLMDQGNQLRKQVFPGPYCILASGVAHCINQIRQEFSHQMNHEDNTLIQIPGKAFIIDSLKHPDEVEKLREIYPSGFYMFVINESEDSRINYLTEHKNIGKTDARKLICRDMEETDPYGQHTRSVFELADFHLSANVYGDNKNKEKEKDDEERKKEVLKPQIDRILNLIFGNPFVTPTFDEYAMFMAYSSGLRSADLSRQVGAVITKQNDIIATGANDVPCFGGGQYWPDSSYKDFKGGRDYTKGYDSNKKELKKIVDEILDIFTFEGTPQEEEDFKLKSRKAVLSSSLKELTEYGRPVHAEMAAITSCARNGISTKDATLYCSTFPCHSCAKHIIASGIKKWSISNLIPKAERWNYITIPLQLLWNPAK